MANMACGTALTGKPMPRRFPMRPFRAITRRKWLTRRIRYPRAANFLRISRILRVNSPPGRLAVLVVLVLLIQPDGKLLVIGQGCIPGGGVTLIRPTNLRPAPPVHTR